MTVRTTGAIFSPAIRQWWKSKGKNKKTVGRSQGGARDSNLRGDTMDGFRRVIQDLLIDAGVDSGDIFSGSQLSSLAAVLPSYFRATKNWDLIVCRNSYFRKIDGGLLAPKDEPKLLAAIEFKSQEGSIGNNQNNRIEESIGSAADFWSSYEHGNFVHLQPRPWLGYLFVGRYAAGELEKPVRITQLHFPTDPAFAGKDADGRMSKTRYKGPSYAERYKIFMERMIAKKQFDRACFIVTHESIKNAKPNYSCPFPELSGEQFVDGLIRHVRAYYSE